MLLPSAYRTTGRPRRSTSRSSSSSTIFDNKGESTPPTMWQTFGLRIGAERAWFHAENHVDCLRSDFHSLDQGANQFPPSGPVRLLQTGGNALAEVLQIADHQP